MYVGELKERNFSLSFSGPLLLVDLVLSDPLFPVLLELILLLSLIFHARTLPVLAFIASKRCENDDGDRKAKLLVLDSF